jgi:hypothetical protein
MEDDKKKANPAADMATDQPALIYEIRVKGGMDRDFWSDWLGGMEFSIAASQGETVLRGPIADQAELYGLLSRLRNQGLALISVKQAVPGEE